MMLANEWRLICILLPQTQPHYTHTDIISVCACDAVYDYIELLSQLAIIATVAATTSGVVSGGGVCPPKNTKDVRSFVPAAYAKSRVSQLNGHEPRIYSVFRVGPLDVLLAGLCHKPLNRAGGCGRGDCALAAGVERLAF